MLLFKDCVTQSSSSIFTCHIVNFIYFLQSLLVQDAPLLVLRQIVSSLFLMSLFFILMHTHIYILSKRLKKLRTEKWITKIAESERGV